MRFRSVIGQSPEVTFRDALFHGLAPDGGLYVPERIPALSPSFLEILETQSLHSIGAESTSLFIEEIPKTALKSIVEKAWDFPIPLVRLEGNLFLLELFHGPTLAFKDVGARFMAHAMSYFLEQDDREIGIVVATSGDTGSAVAHGFFNVPRITVFVLYPSGKISTLQEQQMTTLGGNIHALEVEGTFDDCQRLVKQALIDPEIAAARNLTTANSINLGRLIPQVVYYIWAIAQLGTRARGSGDAAVDGGGEPVVVVPSGNFGNLTAALYARWMGAPVRHFVAATNANDVFRTYLLSGTFTPRPSIQTLSNAMDVGNPSNLARIQALYGNDLDRIRRDISSVSISDDETLVAMRQMYERTGIVLDPHTAVGVEAALRTLGRELEEGPVIVAATAHPGKFPDVVERSLGKPIALPETLQRALERPKRSTRIAAEFDHLKKLLLP